MNDQVLAERAGAGDHAAFTELFEKYKAGIYRFCLFMLGDATAAEDIYQDVFLNFYRACRSGRQMHNVRGYLLTAARSRCINALRVSQRTINPDVLPESGYEHDLAAYDFSEQLQNALQQIQPQYREAFVLFEIEGYSYDEICASLEISAGALRNRIYRAKLSLQKILGPLFRDSR